MENTFGKNTKKLGFGMMRLPEQAASGKFGKIDIELTRKMVDYFISEGFSYFDTAWMYCGFKSEDAAGDALVSRHNRNELHWLPSFIAAFSIARKKGRKFLLPSLRKPGWIISTTIFFMISERIIIKNIRNSDALNGWQIRRKPDMSNIWAFHITTGLICWTGY